MKKNESWDKEEDAWKREGVRGAKIRWPLLRDVIWVQP